MIITESVKEDIYREYYKKVFGLIISKTNNSYLAEDLAADVFVKVYEKLDTFDETKASLSTWIYTITKNKLTDYYRSRKVFEEIPEDMADDSSVEDDVLSGEMLEVLANALETLDERERGIIILRFYSGKTLKEIAEKMDISYAYVKLLQSRALAKLRDFME